jgi:hypothetical protein
MSETTHSSLPSLPAPAATELAAVAAARRAPTDDGRIRVLCPAGLDPAARWPDGRGPLLAYVIYSDGPTQA